MPRRFLPPSYLVGAVLLPVFVAWGSIVAIERAQLGQPSAEIGRAGGGHPALHQPARPERCLGRPQGPQGLDLGATLPYAAIAAARSLTPPVVRRARAAALDAVRVGRPVSPNRGSRGPPDRVS